MGTGIVSVSLSLTGSETLSRVVLAFAAATWVVLAAVLGLRCLGDRDRAYREARSPAGLTAVAATAVLGARLVPLGERAEAAILLAVAAISWACLMTLVARKRSLPATGSVFMLTVSTVSLAVLAAILSAPAHSPYILYGSLVLLVGGAAAYPLALARFDLGELLKGPGDHWVAGGALAICALAAAEVSLSAARLRTLGALSGVLHAGSVALWIAAMLWLGPLVVGEFAAPRLRYDVRRWATVFPVGMYAACSHQVARAAGIDPIDRFAAVWTWVAFVLWVAVTAAMVARGIGHGRRRRRVGSGSV